MSYTANRWTPEEIETAVGLYKKGKDYKYISGKIDGRSPFAIQCKLETYVLDKINNGSTYKSLAKDLNKPEEDLKIMYESQFKRNATKNGNQPTTNSSNNSHTSNYTQMNNFIAAPNTAFGLINRIMTPFIEYNENLEKLEKLKESGTLDGKIYKEIKKILNANPIDPEKFITQLKSTVETKRICPVKSDSKTSESDDSDDDNNDNNDNNNNNNNHNTTKKNIKKNTENEMEPEIKLPRKRLF
jgi:hypothetical protein